MSVPVTAICAALVATTRSASCRVEGASPWPTRIESAPGFEPPGLDGCRGVRAGGGDDDVGVGCRGPQIGDELHVPVREVRAQLLAYGVDALGVGAEEHQTVQVRQGRQQERQGVAALGAGADDQRAAGAGPGALAGQQRGDGGGAQRADAAAVHHRDGQSGDVVVEGERGVVVLVVAALVESVLVGGLDGDDVAGAVPAEHRVGDRVPVVGLDGEFAGVVRLARVQRAVGAFDGRDDIGQGYVDPGEVSRRQDAQVRVVGG